MRKRKKRKKSKKTRKRKKKKKSKKTRKRKKTFGIQRTVSPLGRTRYCLYKNDYKNG
jgi:hypothetical protein